MEARNLGRADSFLETFAGNLTSIQGMKFSRETYRGSRMYVQVVSGTANALAFGRTGRMVLVASDVSYLREAIDGQGKSSFIHQADYTQLVNQRPRDWSLSLYFNAENYNSILDSMSAQDPGATLMLYNLAAKPAWASTMINAVIIQNGVRLDMYSMMDNTAPSNGGTGLVQADVQAIGNIILLLPQNTVVYFAMPHFDIIGQSILSLAFGETTDPSLLYDEFEAYFGFSLTDDFLSHLNGNWVVYAVPSTSGLLAKQADLDLAISLLVEADQTLDLEMISARLALAGSNSGLDIVPSQQDGATFYQVSDSWSNDPMLAFGQAGGYFAIGTDMQVLQASFPNDQPLATSTAYLEAIKNLPAGMYPYGYMDLESMFANLREGMDAGEIQSFNDSLGALGAISQVTLSNRQVKPEINLNSITVILTDQ
jgi:hypothetical protein